MKIIVKSLFEGNKNFVLTYEDAQKLYEEIKVLLPKNDIIQLDFLGLRIVSSSFLSGSIGLLVKEMKIEEIKQKIFLNNIPDGTLKTLDTVLDNAEKFYQNSSLNIDVNQ